MAAEKEEEKADRSIFVILILVIIIVIGVIIAIPIVYSTGRPKVSANNSSTTKSAPTEYVNNECTSDRAGVVSIGYLVNEEPFPYRLYTYTYRPSVISTLVYIYFGFRHDVSTWSIDSISVVDNTDNTTANIDGDFESNYLTKSYTRCILSNTRSSNGDIVFDLPYSGDFYYRDETNVGMTYIYQPLPVIGGRYYSISFYLENRGYPNNSFVLLIGT